MKLHLDTFTRYTENSSTENNTPTAERFWHTCTLSTTHVTRRNNARCLIHTCARVHYRGLCVVEVVGLAFQGQLNASRAPQANQTRPTPSYDVVVRERDNDAHKQTTRKQPPFSLLNVHMWWLVGSSREQQHHKYAHTFAANTPRTQQTQPSYTVAKRLCCVSCYAELKVCMCGVGLRPFDNT